jgi:hypothetical protein
LFWMEWSDISLFQSSHFGFPLMDVENNRELYLVRGFHDFVCAFGF